MSESPRNSNHPARARDRGLTLPELLISVAMLGLVMVVMSSAVIVTMKQHDSSEGRFNVARAEQNIGMWLPGDLASAASVSVDPAATPCGADTCPDLGLGDGSNALLISWAVQNPSSGEPTFTYTNVSYFFSQADDGSFMLSRIECVNSGGGWSCSVLTVLKDLPGPPGGEPWVPGVTVPRWVIQVSQPLEADAIDDSDIVVGDAEAKNAKRVVVTVHGGGSGEGAGGGTNTISITAGGTNRNFIDADSLQGAPSFVEARSRCGGPITLVVDESQSITSTYIPTVRAGVKAFVEALAGTPVQLQIIPFNDRARALGATAGEWHKYYDMTEPTQATALANATSQITIGGGGGSGYTNWEDALFHAFRNEDGTTATVVPEKLVFFTDGVPTRDRQLVNFRNGVLPAQPEAPAAGWGATNTGTSYNQVAFNRANFYATWARSSVTMIGVAVGPDVTSSSTWVTEPAAGYHVGYEKQSDWTYQERQTFTYQANYWARTNFVYQQLLPSYSARYWTRTGTSGAYTTPVRKSTYDSTANNRKNDYGGNTSNWPSITQTQYNSLNTTSDDTDGIRLFYGTTWTDITQTAYNTGNTVIDESDRFRKWPASSAGSWLPITKAVFDANNYRSDNADGYTTGWTTNTLTKAQYDAANTTPDESDGFRRTNPSGSWLNIDAAAYAARNVTNDESDGVRRTGTGTNWVGITQAEYDANNTSSNDSDGYRQVNVYAPPYTAYDALQGGAIPNDQIIGRLVAGGDDFVRAQLSGGKYTNVAEANLYSTTDWGLLGTALKAVALGECGGTLTLQTRLNGAPASDPFTYENSKQYDASGTELVTLPTIVRTNRQLTTGTFDYNITDGLYRDIVIYPQRLADLSAYQPGGWSCRAGIEPRSFTLVDLPAPDNTSVWKGIRVRVGANEAVSCTQTVTK